MTFTELKTQVKQYTGMTSPEADERIGSALNRHYKRLTSELGLDSVRFVTRLASTTLGVQTVQFDDLEKIDRVLDVTATTRLLEEVSIHAIRSAQPSAGSPACWALQNTAATSVTIRLDTLPQAAYDLQADGWTSLAELSGDDEPAFPSSFHEVLSWPVIKEELLKKEKIKLALEYGEMGEDLLRKFRFYLADSHTRVTVQGGAPSIGVAAGNGAGANNGGASYTQTGLITFDRDTDAPFAVTAGSAKVDNLDADKLDGQTGTAYHDASLLTGSAPASIIPNDAVTYARMQNISAASKLLGRGSSAGSGDPQEISIGTALVMSATTLNAVPDDASIILASQVFA